MKKNIKPKNVCNKCGVSCKCKADEMTKKINNLRQILGSRKERQPEDVPVIKISCKVCKEILLTIGSRPPETGGILLGPIGTDEITHFFFDDDANCTRKTYSPDHVKLNQKLKEEWIPAGIDMKGFVHSHPGNYDTLSPEDLAYINRLQKNEKNEDMATFIAPIVIPSQFRFRPIVVLRERPGVQLDAILKLF